MGNLSKLAYSLGQPVLTTNCYETIHTWNPDCNMAIMDAIPGALRFALKTYASFYLLTNLVSKRGRVDKINWKKFTLDVVQSTVFLVTNMSLYLFFLCRFRHWLGFFSPYSMGLISSIVASGLSVFLEKKTRRPALALYLTNLASETFYRHLANHGVTKMYYGGECVPFAMGLMIFSYLNCVGRLPKSLNGFMNFALKANVTENVIDIKKVPTDFKSFLENLRKKYEKTELCQHADSCVSHSVESFTKNFGIGLVASSALTLLKNYRLIFSNPLKLIALLGSVQNMKIPLFTGSLPLIFNAVRCSLNRVKNVNPVFSNIIAAGLAASSMYVYPTVSIAMYCLWKAIETLYFDLVDRGYLPKIKHGELILYAISTGYVLWNIVIEPRAVRKGYVGFINSLVGGRVALFNQRLWDDFGYISRDMFDGIPKLNTKFVTINPMLYQPIR
ncbi:unnamed protein product [Caenorhabditis angaria]|uniref:Transmembrane protein 135 N-terminal domain-containing protein n=1 Tax=Caenorhabditis angaria TaxID=860376 RepID=A0A9P1IXM7_9PELO|nr:unnamed protein product [Caenorhabditis angaria]